MQNMDTTATPEKETPTSTTGKRREETFKNWENDRKIRNTPLEIPISLSRDFKSLITTIQYKITHLSPGFNQHSDLDDLFEEIRDKNHAGRAHCDLYKPCDCCLNELHLRSSELAPEEDLLLMSDTIKFPVELRQLAKLISYVSDNEERATEDSIDEQIDPHQKLFVGRGPSEVMDIIMKDAGGERGSVIYPILMSICMKMFVAGFMHALWLDSHKPRMYMHIYTTQLLARQRDFNQKIHMCVDEEKKLKTD